MYEKTMFIDYWEMQGQKIEWLAHDGYEYAYVDVKQKGLCHVRGYDDMEIVAKFQFGKLVGVAYQSHVAYSSELYEEYWGIRGGL